MTYIFISKLSVLKYAPLIVDLIVEGFAITRERDCANMICQYKGVEERDRSSRVNSMTDFFIKICERVTLKVHYDIYSENCQNVNNKTSGKNLDLTCKYVTMMDYSSRLSAKHKIHVHMVLEKCTSN